MTEGLGPLTEKADPRPSAIDHRPSTLRKRAIRRALASWLVGGLALALSAMWLSSYRWYTTAGFDFERPRGERVLTRYVRIRWDAGSFWIGHADQPVGRHGDSLDWWDPGGSLFGRSVDPRPQGFGNRLGWWWVDDPSDDPYEPTRYVGAIASRWAGIPGWIPPAVVVALPVGRWLARRRAVL